jgi:hypothetical protein
MMQTADASGIYTSTSGAPVFNSSTGACDTLPVAATAAAPAWPSAPRAAPAVEHDQN